jgi:hypothetical protein
MLPEELLVIVRTVALPSWVSVTATGVLAKVDPETIELTP